MNHRLEQWNDKWADSLTSFVRLANNTSVLVCIDSPGECSQIGLLLSCIFYLIFFFLFSSSCEKYWKLYSGAKACKRKLVSYLSRIQKLTIKLLFEPLTQALSNSFFLPTMLKLLLMTCALNDVGSMAFSWRKPLWDVLLDRAVDWFRSFNSILSLKP